MKKIERGISCHDAYTKSEFVLSAYIIAWTDFAILKEFYSQKYRHVYFPPKSNCINKDHSNWLRYNNEIEAAITNREKETLIKNYVIKGKSILFELSSIKFPRSFPIDIMHLFFENIAPQMFKL
ncbi:unnamed protein product [Rhizophagus irregularis]|uniref:Uncharacterized protein n=1 Tax=Rhizophagus irregularis TaxID=588596 RepID=A0A915YZ03_9GLOM|nr:unnamed protein product [Rhizophagus irregularis]CAB5353767.1 unnamed protein product [Rhizophagus irregularis]